MEWYHDPERYVDAVDIEKHGKGAIELLRDLIVNRHTEYSKLADMWFDALGKPVRLIDSQQETFRLAREAQQLGLTESLYIAQQLGISQRAAQYRLKTLDNRMKIITFQSSQKTFVYGDSIPFFSESSASVQLDKNEIKRAYAGMMIDCPTHGANPSCLGIARVQYGLCSECASVYGRHQDARPLWLQEDIKLLQRQAWSEAKETVFRRHHVLNLDITEVA